MRPIKDTIPLEEARALIDEVLRPVERRERVAIVEANGRVAASDVRSSSDVPPFSRAGMDGFAALAEDTFGASRHEPRTLRVIDKVYTGQVPARPVDPGTCIEIATGAPMPEGADAVVMVEETERDGNDVRVFTP
ncbi:MAG: gephyrin-like molybdotransferase Glp, partial [Vicinamibacterales bacterium]